MDFMYVLCFYYYTFSPFNIYKMLANLPVLVLFLPPFVVSLFIYILYLVSTPIGDFFNIFIPSLGVFAIPLTFLLFAGLVRTESVLKMFK